MVLRVSAVQSVGSLSPGTEGELMIWTFGSQSVGKVLLCHWHFQHEPRDTTSVGALRSDAETGDWSLSCALKVRILVQEVGSTVQALSSRLM
jgi:hypothetical protein